MENITVNEWLSMLKEIDKNPPIVAPSSPNCFPSLEEMGYVKVVKCKDCKHRPRKHWEGDEYEIVAPQNKNGKRDYTCHCLQLHEIPGDSFYCAFGEKE